jgi:hypothetical protein
MATELTQERLKQILDYDPKTGVFTRRGYSLRGGRTSSRGAGERAGWHCANGYWMICVDNRDYTAHRLAWLYVYGRFPNGDTDHINHDKIDNRIANLREATRSQNSANRPPPKHNKSGHKGVHFDRAKGRWVAYIKKDFKRYHLGRYDTMEEAIAARKDAEHKMFGEFAYAS